MTDGSTTLSCSKAFAWRSGTERKTFLVFQQDHRQGALRSIKEFWEELFAVAKAACPYLLNDARGLVLESGLSSQARPEEDPNVSPRIVLIRLARALSTGIFGLKSSKHGRRVHTRRHGVWRPCRAQGSTGTGEKRQKGSTRVPNMRVSEGVIEVYGILHQVSSPSSMTVDAHGLQRLLAGHNTPWVRASPKGIAIFTRWRLVLSVVSAARACCARG